MLLIHYINLTHFRNNPDYLPLIHVYLTLEFLTYIYDTLQVIFFLWINISAKQFHFNFTVVLGYIYSIHSVDNVSIILMRIQMFFGIDDRNLHENNVFVGLMFVSIFAVMSAMCIMPFLIIERCFATFFLSDYEVHPRKHISLLLVLLLITIGVATCCHVRQASDTFSVVVILLTVNAVALVTNLCLRHYNRKQFKKYHSIGGICLNNMTYSLAKRFQISENIRTLHMLNLIVFYMGFMNLLVVCCLMVSSIESLSPERQALCTVVLNSCIFVYSNSLPHIIARCCEKWKRQMLATLKKIGCCRHSAVQVAPLLDTFGTEMKVKATMTSHFDALRSSWDVSTTVFSQ